MANELVKLDFTDEQIALIKSQVAPLATNDELRLFLHFAKRTGLDPLARQIYAIHRQQKNAKGEWVNKMTIQTSIDGFRVIAERSGDYAGQDEPVFTYDNNNNLLSCKITVYRFRGDVRYAAAVGVAFWAEYCQTTKDGNPMGLWAKMPHTMLAKVAESLALRKAYPQDLSGLYTSEEMSQAEEVAEPIPAKAKEVLDENHPAWAAASQAVMSGKYTIDQIKQKYSITQRVEKSLLGPRNEKEVAS
jgi:phage recombination protein Bet